MAKAKPRPKKVTKLPEPEDKIIAKYKKMMMFDQDEEFMKLLDKILVLRNDGMKATNIATYLRIGREIIYNYTCSLPVYLLAAELGELILAARSLKLNLAEYILLMHAEWGVKHVKKHGDPVLRQRMFALAAGDLSA